MQKDEEVGKVASTVPVMISRLLELFTESLILKTNELTLSINARTLTTSHLKQIILSERKFDFLKDLVTHIPDVQVNDEDGGDSNSDQGIRVRQRGRPRKKKEDGVSVPKKRGRKPKAAAPTVEDDDITDSSETEDADSCSDEDGGDSTSEDTVVEGRGSYQSQKRQRVGSLFGPTCSSYVSANCVGVVESGAANPGPSSTVLADRNGGLFQPEPTALRFWNLSATPGNSGVGRTAGETCLPLNLTTAAPAAVSASAVASASGFNSEPRSLQLLTRPDFEGTAFGTTAASMSLAPPGLRLLRPPPAHQPPACQVFAPPIVPPCMLSLNTRSNPLTSQAASEFLRLNSTETLTSRGAAPVSSGSVAEEVPAGSHISSTDGMPPITSAMPSSSGHATHRMPVVSASFLPGAVLVRSMSLPHSCSATKTSLVTLPEDDYDS